MNNDNLCSIQPFPQPQRGRHWVTSQVSTRESVVLLYQWFNKELLFFFAFLLLLFLLIVVLLQIQLFVEQQRHRYNNIKGGVIPGSMSQDRIKVINPRRCIYCLRLPQTCVLSVQSTSLTPTESLLVCTLWQQLLLHTNATSETQRHRFRLVDSLESCNVMEGTLWRVKTTQGEVWRLHGAPTLSREPEVGNLVSYLIVLACWIWSSIPRYRMSVSVSLICSPGWYCFESSRLSQGTHTASSIQPHERRKEVEYDEVSVVHNDERYWRLRLRGTMTHTSFRSMIYQFFLLRCSV